MPVKVRFQSQKDVKPTKTVKGRYGNNTRKLSLLPTISISSLIILLFCGLIWYFNPPSEQTSNKIAGVKDLVVLNDLDDEQVERNTTSDEEQTKDAELSFSTASGLSCSLQFSRKSLYQSAIDKQEQGFWVPQNCKEFGQIQIMRMTQDELTGLSTKREVKAFLIDGIDTYAVVYNDQGRISQYDLQSRLIDLIGPVFSDRNYLDQASAVHTVRSSQKSYFLTGQCGLQPVDGGARCYIWQVDNFNSQKLLLKILYNQRSDQESLFLQDGYYFRFAKLVDENTTPSILKIEQKTGEYELYELTSSNGSTTFRFRIKPTDPVYRNYLT